MSWPIVGRVFRTKVGSGSAKAVLIALANHCDEQGGSCYPSQEAIEVLTELSMDTIQRQLRVLAAAGFITRKKRPGVRGRWASWTYQIAIDKLVDQAAPCGVVMTDDQAAPCGVTRPHHAASPGRTMRLKPFTKPFNKPSRAREPIALDGLGPLGAAICGRIGVDNFTSWFGGASIADATNDSVTLELRTKFNAVQVETRFRDDVLACLQAERPAIERVSFIGRAAA